MHCFASENQIYTGIVTFGVEPFKSLKGQENLLLKNLTCVENVPFFIMGKIFVGKYGIQSTNEIALKRTVTSREFSFSGCTHAHAKCLPVDVLILPILWIFMSDIKLSRNLILAKLSEIR